MYHHTTTESPERLRGAKTSWTPSLAEVSYKFGFVCLFICLQCKIPGSSWFFSDFFHEARHRKVRKMTNLGFEKNSDRLRELKKSQKRGF